MPGRLCKECGACKVHFSIASARAHQSMPTPGGALPSAVVLHPLFSTAAVGKVRRALHALQPAPPSPERPAFERWLDADALVLTLASFLDGASLMSLTLTCHRVWLLLDPSAKPRAPSEGGAEAEASSHAGKGPPLFLRTLYERVLAAEFGVTPAALREAGVVKPPRSGAAAEGSSGGAGAEEPSSSSPPSAAAAASAAAIRARDMFVSLYRARRDAYGAESMRERIRSLQAVALPHVTLAASLVGSGTPMSPALLRGLVAASR